MSIHTQLQVVVSLKLWHSGVTLVSGYQPIETSGSSTDGLYTRKIERSNMAYRLGIHLSKGMSYTIDCLKKHDERNKEEQEGYETRKERPSVNPGLLLLLEVQLLQCGYDRKKSHWNYMRVYAAPARTRGNGGNFNITQAAGRRTAIGSAFLCNHRVFLFLGGFLGGLKDPVEMTRGFLNAGPV
ncbi:hypothetical protein D6C77_05364 [Aureobasidium pullulans]|uniref:Uncharacterized protein n=1 Tax=Aureobasidium pullulans TaxID=5580 RepID=A0AB74JH93_AURPU|nr:hypothetical protein D6D12_09500 [Aureobasidium pullulans]THX40676.1 hypothetical protein D6D11_08626 [Aureobasidium pullulans]TIA58652.1 hypothetical protein D6C77_05364 [Aureobasidium pullulans]